MLSIVGTIIALALLIYLALKGYSLLIISIALAVLVAITSGININEALASNYMTGFMEFAGNYFLIFLFSALFGKVMEDSGAATSIAKGILKLTGKKSRLAVMIAIMTITGALTYGGVSLFVVVFVVMPIARPIFKEMDIPWPMFIGSAFLGSGTFTMTMLPGTPQIQNLIPIPYLDTTATAAPIVGLVATAVVIPFGLWWLNREDKKYTAKKLGYEETKGDDTFKTEGKDLYPSFILSVIPSILLLVLMNVVQISIEISLASAIVVAGILFRKYLNQPMKTFNTGAMNVAAPILNTSAVVGFGSVVSATVGFEMLQNAILDIPGHPLISFAIATNIIVGITGSASGGLGIALDTLGSHYATAVDPEALHRIAAISSGGLDSLPHNGAVVTGLTVAGLTHKEGYKPVFWICVVAPIVALTFAIITALLIY
ncbi:GntP family permease [Virgibacillus sp. NKC19-16]|uniref:GntP family permease n=1 Tax=Virgibacillus salidurans TaxID=2831673 RepID=UPI001F33E518|nr:SLC13 family permease [Virgibacillus sp. NKC19-16]UJL45525.1 GntP family permease [Virgibacillus sp. NKC19-16]